MVIRFDFQVMLGGMSDHLDEILRCREMLVIASGSSYHAALANKVSCQGLGMNHLTQLTEYVTKSAHIKDEILSVSVPLPFSGVDLRDARTTQSGCGTLRSIRAHDGGCTSR